MTWRLRLIILTSLVAGIICSQAFGETKGMPEYKFIKGDVQRYQIEVVMTISSKSSIPTVARTKPVQVKMMGVRRQEIVDVLPNGDAEIAYNFESLKIGNNGEWQDTPLNQVPAMSMLISKNGVVKSIHGMERTGPFAQMPFLNTENLDQYFGVLPPVLPANGSTWTQEIPFPKRDANENSGALKIKGKIVNNEEMLQGAPAIKFEQIVEGKQIFSMPLTDVAPDSSIRSMKASGTITAQATNYFSPITGKMLLTQGTGHSILLAAYNNERNERVEGINTGVIASYRIFLLPNRR